MLIPSLKLLFDNVTDLPPAGGTNLSGGGKTSTIDLVQDLDFLKPGDKPIELEGEKPVEEEKEKEIETKDEEDSDKESEDDDDLDGLLEELEDPTEEQLEIGPPTSRRAILKKYPKVFDDFPALEKSYYRDAEFTKAFGTPQEANEAREQLGVLSSFEDDLMKGNVEKIFSSVNDLDKDAFLQVVDNLLPTIEKIDKNAYVHILENNAKQFISHMWDLGKRNNDEDLQNAARSMNKLFFGSEQYTPPTKLSSNKSNEKSSKEIELEKREKEFNDRQVGSAKSQVTDTVDRLIKGAIAQRIDEKQTMSEYVRKQATRDAYETYQSQVSRDSNFNKIIDRLWENAAKVGHTKVSLDKIVDAYRSKAGSLLGAVIKHARNEALRGMGKRVRNDSDEPDEKESGTRRTSRSPRRVEAEPDNKGPVKGKRIIPEGMSTAEWLAMKD